MKRKLLYTGLAFLFILNVNAQGIRKQMAVSRAADAIVIDGNDDDADWAKISEITNDGFWKFDPNLGDWGDFGPSDDTPTESDLKVTFKLLNKAEGIYLFVKVMDDDLNIFYQNPGQSENFWEFDDLELYLHYQNQHIDSSLVGDVSPSSTTFRVFYNIGNPEENPITKVTVGGDSDGYDPIEADAIKIIQCSGHEISGGYTVEMFIPFEIWKNTLLADGSNVPYTSIDSLGFELCITDVDSDPKPDQVSSWNEDNSYGKLVPWQPNYLGRIDLKEYHADINDSKNNNTLVCYPNPVVGNTINISSENIQSITLYGITGQKIKSITDVRSNNKTIDISDVKSGLYIVNVISNNGNISSQKITIK